MDFLNELKKLLEVDSNAKFARLCGKQASNMAGYLKGKTPGTSVLQDCLLNATVARILDSPADADARLEGKARNLREKLLDTSMSRVFDHGIQTLCEVEAIPEDLNDISDVGGVYVLYDSAGNVLYVGKAKNFRREVRQTLDRSVPVGMRFGPGMRKVKPVLWDLAYYMSLYAIGNPNLRHNIEALLIRVFINQTHNSNIGKFKVG